MKLVDDITGVHGNAALAPPLSVAMIPSNETSSESGQKA